MNTAQKYKSNTNIQAVIAQCLNAQNACLWQWQLRFESQIKFLFVLVKTKKLKILGKNFLETLSI